MPTLSKTEALDCLPSVHPAPLMSRIRAALKAPTSTLVVLDDDPTGTQTVRDIPVLTEWSVSQLAAEFENDLPCFYILTNSRSMNADAAIALNREIVANLTDAGKGRPFSVGSRADSTRRGHYAEEVDTRANG